MQIELSDSTSSELHRRAAALGLNVSAYVEALLLATPASAVGVTAERTEPYTVEEWLANLEKSNAHLGRDGMPWREFIHQGHKY